MDELLPLFLGILTVLGLVIANAFFVAVEFALVRARETKLQSPEFIRQLGAKSALTLIGRLDASISATQLGITITSLTLGWWAELTFQKMIIRAVSFLGESAALWVSHGIATAIALVIATFLHVVLGELIPKTIAIRYPETTLRFLAPPMLVFAKAITPFVWFMNGTANFSCRLLGLRAAGHDESAHSTAELAILIAQSTESGHLDKDEEQMLKGVFEFSHTVAREVMTPRMDLLTIAADASLEQVLVIVGEAGFSRIPVVGNNVDDIIGVLLVKELLPNLRQLTEEPSTFDVSNFMREPFFIPGTKPIDDLLKEFKLRKQHLAVVLDEHGGVDGIVTLEDILEEIVGDIYDESDTPERDIIVRDDGDIIIDGGVLVADINSRFGLAIPEGDYDTIAGFIFSVLGRIPSPGDEIRLGYAGIFQPENADSDYSSSSSETNGMNHDRERALLTIQRVRANRIASVKVRLFQISEESLETEPESSSSKTQDAISVQDAKS
mgnify:CR=1 FL=1